MPDPGLSDELKAMAQMESALESLKEEARARVLRWAADRYGAAVAKAKSEPRSGMSPEKNNGTAVEYSDLSEFYSAATPSTDAERALVAAYWFQYREDQVDVEAQGINKELKHLGHRVGNITRAFDALKDQKPALVVQTRKEGTTKQARKKYKVTAEGKKRVERMLSETKE